MLKLGWQNLIPDIDVLERTGILSIHAMLRQLQLRWCGHPNGSSVEMSLRVPAAKEAKSVKQGHSKDLTEASADQSGQLARPLSLPTDLEEDSENRRSDLRGKPHRHRESQKRSTQISAAPTSQREGPAARSVSMVSANIPDANWTCLTPSDQLQHSHCTNHCLSVYLSLASYTVNQH
ncbi:hypothetical protein SprV_0100371100 [Sparganum proliferum]